MRKGLGRRSKGRREILKQSSYKIKLEAEINAHSETLSYARRRISSTFVMRYLRLENISKI